MSSEPLSGLERIAKLAHEANDRAYKLELELMDLRAERERERSVVEAARAVRVDYARGNTEGASLRLLFAAVAFLEMDEAALAPDGHEAVEAVR